MTVQAPVRIERIADASALAPLRDAWTGLARGVPFRGFDWLEAWWTAYGQGPRSELFVLAAFDATDQLVALAPWYLEHLGPQRRVIRFLGSGEVCSEYLTILCQAEYRQDVALALADWLCGRPEQLVPRACGWDSLELVSVDRNDATVNALLAQLADRGHLVYRRNRSSCWRVALPSTWDQYLAMLSKSHRKQIRRLERRYFDSGRAVLHRAQAPGDLRHGLDVLARLHQRRRESLGERGRFASTAFASFHEQTARRLLASGDLRLVWLKVDGQTVAAEYQVLGDGVVYAYQSGIEPMALVHEPGRLITLSTLKQAIGEGRHAFDFLRGDESYKAHWRAKPRPTQDVRVLPDTRAERLRHSLWTAGGNMKDWIKRGLKFSGVTSS